MCTVRNALFLRAMFAVLFVASGTGQAQPSETAILPPQEAETVSGWEGVPEPIAHQSAPMFSQPSATPAQYGVTLSDLLDLAIAQSPKLSVQRAKVGESQMAALATGLFPNPFIEGGGKHVSGGDSGLVLGINQELPLNGARRWERQAATLRFSAANAALEREIQVVFSEIESAYVEVLAAQSLVAADQRGLETASASLRLVSDSYRAGLASSLPLTLAVSVQANARKTLQLSEGQMQVTRAKLAGLLALHETSLQPVAGDLKHSILPPGLDPGVSNRPDLRAAQIKVQAAQSTTEADRRKMMPNPVLGYEREEGEDTENFLTLGLEFPLFDSGRPRVQQSMAAQQVASREQSALAQTIQTEVAVGAGRLNSARKAVSIYENEILPSIMNSLEAANGAFQSGTTDLSLLLQTQSSLIEHEREYIRALEELRSAEIAYKLAIGIRKESRR